MADEGEEPEVVLDDEDEEGGTTGKKKLIFIIIGALLLIGGGVGGFLAMSGGGEEEAATEEMAEGEEGEGGETLAESGEELAAAVKGEKEDSVPVYYDVPEFLVDLNSSDRRKSSFLKMKVAIELSKQEDVELLEQYMPRVRDNFITYLRELRASDLSGSAGLYRLREELLLRINQAIAPAKVNNILFKEIIVQ